MTSADLTPATGNIPRQLGVRSVRSVGTGWRRRTHGGVQLRTVSNKRRAGQGRCRGRRRTGSIDRQHLHPRAAPAEPMKRGTPQSPPPAKRAARAAAPPARLLESFGGWWRRWTPRKAAGARSWQLRTAKPGSFDPRESCRRRPPAGRLRGALQCLPQPYPPGWPTKLEVRRLRGGRSLPGLQHGPGGRAPSAGRIWTAEDCRWCIGGGGRGSPAAGEPAA